MRALPCQGNESSFHLAYVAGRMDHAWGSVSDLHACLGFRCSKKVENTDIDSNSVTVDLPLREPNCLSQKYL